MQKFFQNPQIQPAKATKIFVLAEDVSLIPKGRQTPTVKGAAP